MIIEQGLGSIKLVKLLGANEVDWEGRHVKDVMQSDAYIGPIMIRMHKMQFNFTTSQHSNLLPICHSYGRDGRLRMKRFEKREIIDTM